MPIDVRMPDGTLVKNVPDNITQADLAARFDAFKAQVATPVPSEIPQAPVTGPEGAPIPPILTDIAASPAQQKQSQSYIPPEILQGKSEAPGNTSIADFLAHPIDALTGKDKVSDQSLSDLVTGQEPSGGNRPFVASAAKGIMSVKSMLNNSFIADMVPLMEKNYKDYGPNFENAPPDKKQSLLKDQAELVAAFNKQAEYNKDVEAVTKKYGTDVFSKKADALYAKPEFQNADTFKKFQLYGKEILSNPQDIPTHIATVSLESLPSTIRIILASTLAKFMGLGPSGIGIVGGQESASMEYASSYVEKRQQGMSHEEAHKEAGEKSVVIGFMDAISMKSAGKALDKIMSQVDKGITKRVLNTAKETAKELNKQGLYGLSGEVLGSAVSGQKIDPRAALDEYFGELATGPLEALTTYQGKLAEEKAAGAEPAPPGGGSPPGRGAPPVSERIEPEVTPIRPRPEDIATPAPVEPVTEPTKIETSHDTQAMLDELAGKDVEYVPEEEDRVAEPKPRETIKEFIDRATPEELEDFRQKNAALDMSDEGRRLRAEKEQQEALDEANKILTVLEANKSLAPVEYVQLTEDLKNGDIKSLRDLKDYRKIYNIITKKQAEPEGVITEEEKEFTPVGGRLINKADADKLARESAIALQQNLATQEAEKEATLKREIREEKFREPVTQTLSAKLVEEGGIAKSQKLDMLRETGKIKGYEHVFREKGGDLLTMVKDGLLDDYLPPDIRSTATPPDGLFDARPGYDYISDLISTNEKVHHYDYEMAKIQHENMVAEKDLAKQQMDPNQAAQVAAAEIQGKEYMNVEPSTEVIPTPSETKFHEDAKTYVSEVPDWYFTDQTPSFKIEMNKLRRRIKQGSIKQEDVIPEIESIYQATKKERPVLDRQRGAAIIKEKLLAAKRRKELSPEMVDMAEWFINQNPDLVQDLAVSVTQNKRDGVSGGYLPLSKLAKIFKYSPNDMTAVHEMLHHTERMLPTDIQDAIRKAWSKSLQKDSERAFGGTNESLKEYYRNVIDYHTKGKKEYEDKAMQMLADNVIPYEHYKNFNPSEFWATKGSEIVQGRYKADISDSIVAKIKNWLKEFIETVKGIFNISDDAAVIKALNSLAKSDGKFITDMIHDDKEALNVEKPSKTFKENADGVADQFGAKVSKENVNLLEPLVNNLSVWYKKPAATYKTLKENRTYSEIMEGPFDDMALNHPGRSALSRILNNSLRNIEGLLKNATNEEQRNAKAYVFREAFERSKEKEYLSIGQPPKNFKGQEVIPQWESPDPESKLDLWIYRLQNKQIDTKRVQQAIGEIEDNWNVYEKEQLYHGRTASGIRNFLLKELLPVIKQIEELKISPEEVRTYLHNRHAEERNIQMNKINPGEYDPKTNTFKPSKLKDKGSGIHTDTAREYLSNLDQDKKKILDKVAAKFDQMVRGTQQILISSGAESSDTIAKWNKTYKHYVPLFRVEDEMAKPSGLSGTGQGFGTRGDTSKRAMGSEKEVQDILSNIIAQRERALIRAEKIRVGRAVYGLAIQNPNPNFWLPINPDAIRNKKQAVAELARMGIPDAKDMIDNLMAEPKERYLKKVQVAEGGVEPEEEFDFDSGLPVNQSKEVVAAKVNVMSRYKDYVFPIRIDGKDRYVFFNQKDPRAVRMVQSLKNLDVENLGWAIGLAGKATRWFKSVNTQYNPVFGLINFLRDFGGTLLNLTNTEIKGKQAQVIAGSYKAMAGILNVHRAERKGKAPSTGPWATLYQEYRDEGTQTGYRDSLIRNQEEMQIIEHTLAQFKDGNTKKAFYAVLGGLTDYNDMMENAFRLSAYKVALDQGLSKQKAAIIAKNLTVNFDRKGAWTASANALYAFFNASVQGTERIYQTLKGPKGKMIIGGGILAGMVQAVMLAAAGYDEDDPPEFVREKNFIIPLADGTYFTIPYPLGYNVLPSSGRIVMEFMLHGGKNPGKHVASLTSAIVNSVNPLGSSGFATQTLMPTVIDPLVALGENKDSFGRPISRKDRATAPTPGYSRSRETSTALGKGIAEFLNWASGGDKYVKGSISPTGDDVDFLAGQIGGGLYREISKAAKAVGSTITGEEIPAYRRPIVGRFIGETGSNAAISQTFYENVTRLTDHENTIKGLKKDKLPTDSYKAKHPEARLWPRANSAENQINAINKDKREAIAKNKPKEVIQRLDEKKARIMKKFNDEVKQANAD